ncbi:hypothetical protein BT93_C2308 [Corymbia citriodora subsp. variegata]|nr:hypothetical protein BT93_C2308 [Corymbia citriodora subsp. variegata]
MVFLAPSGFTMVTLQSGRPDSVSHDWTLVVLSAN